jgi:hypothetical protein
MEVSDATDRAKTGNTDDTTNEHYSMFFVHDEVTASSF